MAIKASTPGAVPQSYPGSKPMGTKGSAGYTSDHRGFPAENLGLMARMDAHKDSMGEGEYSDALRSAMAHPSYSGNGGADYAQDEFERRHDRRQSDKMNDPYRFSSGYTARPV